MHEALTTKIETLLGQKIHNTSFPSSGFDHTVLFFETEGEEKLVAKADLDAVIDALVLEKITAEKIKIPVPKLIAYSDEDKLSIFEFVDGAMLDTLEEATKIKILPKLLEVIKNLHVIKGETSGVYEQVNNGKKSTWRDFFGLKYSNKHSYYKWEELLSDKRFDRTIIKKALDDINSKISNLKEPVSYSLLHGDLHGGNIIVNKDSIAAIIDWSDAIYGDPLYDYSRLRLFLIRDNRQMLKIYYDFLRLTEDEREREELYYLAHCLRSIFFGAKEDIELIYTNGYFTLKNLVNKF